MAWHPHVGALFVDEKSVPKSTMHTLVGYVRSEALALARAPCQQREWGFRLVNCWRTQTKFRNETGRSLSPGIGTMVLLTFLNLVICAKQQRLPFYGNDKINREMKIRNENTIDRTWTMSYQTSYMHNVETSRSFSFVLFFVDTISNAYHVLEKLP